MSARECTDTEYGVFNDEGCVERDFWTRSDAERAARERYGNDAVRVCAVCVEHEEPADACEECDAEDEVAS